MWSAFRDALDAAPRDLSWAQSSHDDPRAPTRFGGGALGADRALAYSVLLMGLPGLPFLYQGDELGLADVDVPPADRVDPVAVRSAIDVDGRDGCRTPIPWSPGPQLGFTTAERAWLPLGDRADGDTVEVQRAEAGSTLHRYQQLLAARRALPELRHAELEWLTGRDEAVIAFLRGRSLCAVNLGDAEATLGLPPGRWRVAFSSCGERAPVSGTIDLAAPEGVLLALE